MVKTTSLVIFFVVTLLVIECHVNQDSTNTKSGLNILNLMSGLEEAAEQIGDTSAFKKYSNISKGKYSGTLLYYAIGNVFYVNEDMSLFKRLGSLLLNGVDETGDTTYDNEVVSKSASEGAINQASEFAVTSSVSGNYTVAEVKALGYNFYELPRTANKAWKSTNWGNGTGNWEGLGADPPFIHSYYLIKKTDSELVLIEITLSGSTYSISEDLENPEDSSILKN